MSRTEVRVEPEGRSECHDKPAIDEWRSQSANPTTRVERRTASSVPVAPSTLGARSSDPSPLMEQLLYTPRLPALLVPSAACDRDDKCGQTRRIQELFHGGSGPDRAAKRNAATPFDVPHVLSDAGRLASPLVNSGFVVALRPSLGLNSHLGPRHSVNPVLGLELQIQSNPLVTLFKLCHSQ